MLLVLSIIDIIAGICLGISLKGILAVIIGLIILFKAFVSLGTSLGSGYIFDWMGWIDLIAGLSLLIGFIIPWLWVIVIIKGIYSLVFSLN